MNTAIALSLLAGCGWAINIVLVRWSLDRTSAPPLVGALVGLGTAAILVSIVALISSQPFPDATTIGKFALVGAIAPGSSQGLFVSAIGAIGTSRSSVLVSTNPMVSVLLAMILLNEDWQVVVIVGTLLTVAGGALISWEPGIGFRQIGVVLALATAFTFGVRDVVARQFSTTSDVSSIWSAAIVLSTASLVVAGIALVQRRRKIGNDIKTALPEFALSGVAIAIALTSLFGAINRGQISLVAPLSNAAQSLAVVALGTVVFGARERTNRILIALVLVVIGGALITTA